MFKKFLVLLFSSSILSVPSYLSASEMESLPDQPRRSMIKVGEARPSVPTTSEIHNAGDVTEKVELMDPGMGTTPIFNFDANAIIETYLRKIISERMLEGDLKKNLNDIAIKLGNVIDLAGQQDDFVMKIFAPRKAEHLQESIHAFSELIYVTCQCFYALCRSIPSQQLQEKLNKWEKEAAKTLDLVKEIKLNVKDKSAKTQSTINGIREVFILKARKLQKSVFELAKVCDPKTDRITMLEVLFSQISAISLGEKNYLLG